MVDLPIWPSEAYKATEDRWEKMVSEWFYDGVVVTQNYNGEPTTGLLEPYGDSSGMVAKVKTGAGLIRGFFIDNDTLRSLTIVAADANPRWDRIVLQFTIGGASALGKLIVKKGTAAASNQVIPALEVSDTVREVAIGRVWVPGGAITIRAIDVYDERIYSMPKITDPVGTVKMFYGAGAPSGHLAMNGQVVATATYPVLARLWGVQGSTNMTIPDMTGYTPRGTTTGFGNTGGSDTVTLNINQLPSHGHSFSGTWSGGNHAHSFAGDAHSHSASQPAHNHQVNDPGHRHGIGGDQGYRFVVTAPSSISLVNKGANGWSNEVSITQMDAVGTGIWLNDATPGVSVNAAYVSGTVAASGNLSGSVSGTIGSTGANASVDVTPRHRQLLFIIKAH